MNLVGTKTIILLGAFMGVLILLPVSFYFITLDTINKRHLQFTSDQEYIQKVSCQDLKGNLTNIESVQLFNVDQLKDDIKTLEKEKGCI